MPTTMTNPRPANSSWPMLESPPQARDGSSDVTQTAGVPAPGSSTGLVKCATSGTPADASGVAAAKNTANAASAATTQRRDVDDMEAPLFGDSAAQSPAERRDAECVQLYGRLRQALHPTIRRALLGHGVSLYLPPELQSRHGVDRAVLPEGCGRSIVVPCTHITHAASSTLPPRSCRPAAATARPSRSRRP